jgi:cytochrome P450
VRRITDCLSAREFNPFQLGWRSWARERQLRKDLQTLDQIVFRVIAEKRRRPGGDDLLSMLLDARDTQTGQTMDEAQLRDEVMNFFLPGYETTATALTWTWILLSQHPEWRQRIYAEGVELPSSDSLDYDSVERLHCSSRVLKESMRLYPPVWLQSRIALGNDELGGYRIPQGSIVLLSSYVAHRNPSVWRNPEGFDPFEDGGNATRSAYFPFGAGPRLCIGRLFALTEAQLAIAKVMAKWQLDLVPGQKVQADPGIVLRPKGRVLMTLREAPPTRRATIGVPFPSA